MNFFLSRVFPYLLTFFLSFSLSLFSFPSYHPSICLSIYLPLISPLPLTFSFFLCVLLGGNSDILMCFVMIPWCLLFRFIWLFFCIYSPDSGRPYVRRCAAFRFRLMIAIQFQKYLFYNRRVIISNNLEPKIPY